MPAPTVSSVLPTTALTLPTRVALRTSAPLVRAGFEALLGDHRDQVVVTTSSSRGPDVEVVDVSRPGDVDLDRSAPTCPRIVLAWDDLPRTAYRAELLGSSCILPISVGAHELIRAIRRLHHGVPVSRPRPSDTEPLGLGVFSARESGILSRICDGKSNEEIARELFLSINTIKTYVRTAYRKMDVTSRSQAVIWGLEHGY